MTKSMTYFDYDDFGNLARANYDGKGELYKTPDAVGNLYKTQDRSDRKYGKGGKLLKDEKYYYKYDQLGNLVHKSPRDITKPLVFEKPTNWIDRLAGNKEEEKRLQKEHESWQYGDTAYTWLANGMLESVQNPDGKIVRFEYDALGRRTAKIANQQINRYFWDGNVLLQEWKYDLNERPKLVVVEDDLVYDKPEPVENLITWVYEGGSFVPSAKIIGKEKFSIINDYIGRPIQAYNENGDVVWDTDYDIYGDLRELKGDRSFIPFRQLGQYEDQETGLYYNRFRYYSPETGTYLSQDPIGLAGNNPNFYAYVHDPNSWIDPFGLDIIRLRHYTSSKGLAGIQESMIINAGDQNAVFAVRAKGRPLSMADAAEKFKVKENHTRNYIDFDIDDSRVEFRKNNLGVEEYKIRGDIELDSETTKFVKRCG